MDQTQFSADGAVAQPSVADSMHGNPAGSGVSGESLSPLVNDQSGQGATDASATPPQQPQPADTTDYRALWEQNAPKMQQYEQAFGELRQMMAQAQAQQAEQEARTAAQQRLDRAYQLAETMPVEDAFRYIRQVEDQERAGLHGAIQQIRQESQQREYQVAAQISAPLYAIHLGKTHQLPPDMVERLQMIGDPRQMDGYLPVLKSELVARNEQQRKYQDVLAQLDQLQRSQQANVLAANGAHSPGNPGTPMVTTPDGQYEAGSRDHLLSKLPPGFFGGGQ